MFVHMREALLVSVEVKIVRENERDFREIFRRFGFKLRAQTRQLRRIHHTHPVREGGEGREEIVRCEGRERRDRER